MFQSIITKSKVLKKNKFVIHIENNKILYKEIPPKKFYIFKTF